MTAPNPSSHKLSTSADPREIQGRFLQALEFRAPEAWTALHDDVLPAYRLAVTQEPHLVTQPISRWPWWQHDETDAYPARAEARLQFRRWATSHRLVRQNGDIPSWLVDAGQNALERWHKNEMAGLASTGPMWPYLIGEYFSRVLFGPFDSSRRTMDRDLEWFIRRQISQIPWDIFRGSEKRDNVRKAVEQTAKRLGLAQWKGPSGRPSSRK